MSADNLPTTRGYCQNFEVITSIVVIIFVFAFRLSGHYRNNRDYRDYCDYHH